MLLASIFLLWCVRIEVITADCLSAYASSILARIAKIMNRIFINGCFDILHTGHLNLLEHASSLGGFVLVAIDSDRRVRASKGMTRPVNSAADRVRMLRALRMVDSVLVFDSDLELKNIIKEYEPDVMVKGKDYKDRPIIGSQYCKRIEFVELNEKSTTKTLQSAVAGR